MAATFIKALKERYEQGAAAASPNWPSLWKGIQPEGAARDFPNVVMQHLGETPTYAQGTEGPPLTVDCFDGEVKFNVFHTTDDGADSLAQEIMAFMEDPALTIGADTDVRLFRGKYMVYPTPQRGPVAQFVYVAVIPYKARFNP